MGLFNLFKKKTTEQEQEDYSKTLLLFKDLPQKYGDENDYDKFVEQYTEYDLSEHVQGTVPDLEEIFEPVIFALCKEHHTITYVSCRDELTNCSANFPLVYSKLAKAFNVPDVFCDNKSKLICYSYGANSSLTKLNFQEYPMYADFCEVKFYCYKNLDISNKNFDTLCEQLNADFDIRFILNTCHNNLIIQIKNDCLHEDVEKTISDICTKHGKTLIVE